MRLFKLQVINCMHPVAGSLTDWLSALIDVDVSGKHPSTRVYSVYCQWLLSSPVRSVPVVAFPAAVVFCATTATDGAGNQLAEAVVVTYWDWVCKWRGLLFCGQLPYS